MGKVVVIGAGPAGMMAAVTAADKHSVVLLESNSKLGRKLYITGKGRCNVTNAKDISEFFDNIPGNPNFMYSSLYTFTNQNTMDFFEEQGVRLKVERGDRVFPESDKSSDIIDAFNNVLKKKKVDVRCNSKVREIHRQNEIIDYVILEGGEKIFADYFIICTGGVSYPLTGSTGDGLAFAKEIGHNVIKPTAALVPIELEEDYIKELQGLSLKNVKIRVLKNNKALFDEFGEMIFTHFGVSGPIILSASRAVREKGLTLSINLKPALTEEELDRRLQSDFAKYINKDFRNSLSDLLPQKLINLIIKLSGIDEFKKVNSITKEERKKLVTLMQNFDFKIKGLRPVDEAIVTAGGVDVKEIDPSTMKSKLLKNLYFAGEVIDVDAYTGGYNIQIALSTGYLAGMSIGS